MDNEDKIYEILFDWTRSNIDVVGALVELNKLGVTTIKELTDRLNVEILQEEYQKIIAAADLFKMEIEEIEFSGNAWKVLEFSGKYDQFHIHNLLPLIMKHSGYKKGYRFEGDLVILEWE